MIILQDLIIILAMIWFILSSLIIAIYGIGIKILWEEVFKKRDLRKKKKGVIKKWVKKIIVMVVMIIMME